MSIYSKTVSLLPFPGLHQKLLLNGLYSWYRVLLLYSLYNIVIVCLLFIPYSILIYYSNGPEFVIPSSLALTINKSLVTEVFLGDYNFFQDKVVMCFISIKLKKQN